jgi:hypothetical protein
MNKEEQKITDAVLEKIKDIHNESVDYVCRKDDMWFEDEYRQAQVRRLIKSIAFASFIRDHVMPTVESMEKSLPEAMGTDEAGAKFLSMMYLSNFLEEAVEVMSANSYADETNQKES